MISDSRSLSTIQLGLSNPSQHPTPQLSLPQSSATHQAGTEIHSEFLWIHQEQPRHVFIMCKENGYHSRTSLLRSHTPRNALYRMREYWLPLGNPQIYFFFLKLPYSAERSMMCLTCIHTHVGIFSRCSSRDEDLWSEMCCTCSSERQPVKRSEERRVGKGGRSGGSPFH